VDSREHIRRFPIQTDIRHVSRLVGEVNSREHIRRFPIQTDIRPLVGEVNSREHIRHVGRWPAWAALAISYACTHSDSIPYLAMRRISPPIQTDS